MIKVGDRVRSFDFGSREVEGEAACFVEGVVRNITNPAIDTMFRDCAHYEIRVDRRVLAGEEINGAIIGGLVYPPVNGTPSTFSGITDYVELV
jgi:hypothetical protein